jgi:hypothetical protein
MAVGLGQQRTPTVLTTILLAASLAAASAPIVRVDDEEARRFISRDCSVSPQQEECRNAQELLILLMISPDKPTAYRVEQCAHLAAIRTGSTSIKWAEACSMLAEQFHLSINRP